MSIGEFPRKLKAARKKAGFTQAELAEKLGTISDKAISSYESGRSSPDLSTLDQIAHALGVKPSYFFSAENDSASLLNAVVLDKMDMIPILGRVSAGIGIPAKEDLEGLVYKLSNADFALRVKGDSMTPRYPENALVFVKREEQINNGDDVVIIINGDDAVVKTIEIFDEGIMLRSYNMEYRPQFIPKAKFESECKIVGVVKGCYVER